MKLVKNCVALLFVVLTQMMAQGASPPPVAWQNHYGTSVFNEYGDDYCTASVQLSDGGKLLLGYTYAGPYGQEDGLVIWISSQGTELRRKFYGTDQYDYLVDGKQLSDGGFVLVGTSNGKGWILKINAQGDVLWDTKPGGTGMNAFNGIIPLPDGGFVAIGVSTSVPSGNKTSPSYGNGDGWAVWMDSQGNVVRDRSYGGDKTDQFTVGFRTGNGNLFFGGYSYSGVSGNKTSANRGGADYWFLLVDIDGTTILRDKGVGGGYDDKMFDAFPTSDGGLVGVGYSNSGATGDKTSAGFGYEDGWVVKLSSDWDVSWNTGLGGTADDFFNKGLQALDGNIVVVGGSYSDASGNKTSSSLGFEDGLVAKLDPTNGTVLWDVSIGTADTENFTGVQVNADGGIFLSGSSWAFTDGGFWVVQLASPPPLVLSVTGITDGNFNVQLTGPSGLYDIQASSDLINWTTLTSVSINGTGHGSFADPESPTISARFYRAVKVE